MTRVGWDAAVIELAEAIEAATPVATPPVAPLAAVPVLLPDCDFVGLAVGPATVTVTPETTVTVGAADAAAGSVKSTKSQPTGCGSPVRERTLLEVDHDEYDDENKKENTTSNSAGYNVRVLV